MSERNDDWRGDAIERILSDDFRRANFGGPARGSRPWLRVVVRPVEVRGERRLQFSFFDGKKDISKNYDRPEAAAELQALLDAGFTAIHISTAAEEIDIRISKKGKVALGRSPAKEAGPVERSHNRVKELPLPEGKADHLLQTMGIMTPDGKIRAAMRGKFAQINEFLKQLAHTVDDAGLRRLGREMVLLDCGCGSSYLTLAAHHYLRDILNIPARIHGVDANEELIRKSVGRSESLAAQGIEFACARIEEASVRPDVVVALHACDTATDDAIAAAIGAEARLLLSVPCCHRHLNRQLRAEGPAEPLRPVLRHGILHERLADLVTDAFRAAILRIMGYRTDVVEFVSQEHTARNLMIRAVRSGKIGDCAAVSEYREMRTFWGVTPYLETLLGARFAEAAS